MLRILKEWRARSRALSEERKLDSDEIPRRRQLVDKRIEDARRALESGDHETALRHWQEARAQHPDMTMGSRAGLQLLIGLNRLDDAEELMREGCERWPRNPLFAEGAAIVAARRGDLEAAARHYATLRQKFPGVDEGYTAGATTLVKLGRLDEADRVFSQIVRIRGTLWFQIEHARLAMMCGDWPVALTRWAKIWNERGHESAEIGMARCYKEIGRFDEAERILTNALKRPRSNSLDFRIELALIGERKETWDEAVRRWNDVRMSAPSKVDAYCRGAFALGKCGREDEAETLLHEAIQRFPSDAQPWIDFAMIAEGRGSTSEAEARWEQVRARFPDHASRYRAKSP